MFSFYHLVYSPLFLCKPNENFCFFYWGLTSGALRCYIKVASLGDSVWVLNITLCFSQVAWEVQTAPESLARSDQAYDLFLLGSMMPGVSSVPAQRRANTGTYVYCFDGTNNGMNKIKALEQYQVSFLNKIIQKEILPCKSTAKEAWIKGAMSRQSSSFCLILPITHPQSLWNLK